MPRRMAASIVPRIERFHSRQLSANPPAPQTTSKSVFLSASRKTLKSLRRPLPSRKRNLKLINSSRRSRPLQSEGPFPGAQPNRNPLRQELVIPPQKDSIPHPAHTTGTRQRSGAWAITGQIRGRLGQDFDAGSRPQAQQSGNRHLQHGDIAHVLVFGSACIQTCGDDDAHCFSIPRPLSDRQAFALSNPCSKVPPRSWFTSPRTLQEHSIERHVP